MAFVKVQITDDASGQQRERVVDTVWRSLDRAAHIREAKRIVDNWRGVSNPRVIAIMTETGWQEVADGQG